MTHDELRQSGLLELYMADACTAEERLLVEQAAQQDPQIQRELDEIAASIEAYARDLAIQPPASLRASILERINDDATADQPMSATPHNVVGTLPTAPVLTRISRGMYLRAASIGIIIGLLPSLYLYFERAELVQERDSARTQLVAANERTSVIAQRVSRIQSTIDKVVNEDVRRVALPAVAQNDLASATVFWNATTKEVLIDARNLPVLPSTSDYQLWAIVDGKPVDLGVIDVSDAESALHAMKVVGSPAMFAITVEPKGGSVSPTLTAMKVAGKV